MITKKKKRNQLSHKREGIMQKIIWVSFTNAPGFKVESDVPMRFIIVKRSQWVLAVKPVDRRFVNRVASFD